MSNLKHTIDFYPSEANPPKPIIEPGALYEDPIAGRTLKWFVGTLTANGTPALTSLTTGAVYRYPDGKVPGAIRPVGPGTLTIIIREGPA